MADNDKELVTLANREDELLAAARVVGRLEAMGEKPDSALMLRSEHDVLRKAVSYSDALREASKAALSAANEAARRAMEAGKR